MLRYHEIILTSHRKKIIFDVTSMLHTCICLQDESLPIKIKLQLFGRIFGAVYILNIISIVIDVIWFVLFLFVVNYVQK